MTSLAIPPPQRYDRVSAWQLDGWLPDAVWHWRAVWHGKAPFACGASGGNRQPYYGPDDGRAICPECLAASMPR